MSPNRTATRKVRWTSEELDDIDSVLDRGEDHSKFVRFASSKEVKARKKSKRKITPEQQAKMQAARKRRRE